MNFSDINPVFAGGSESYHFKRANEKYSDLEVVNMLAVVMLERNLVGDSYDALGAALAICRYQRSIFVGERLFYETHMRLNAQAQGHSTDIRRGGGAAQPNFGGAQLGLAK